MLGLSKFRDRKVLFCAEGRGGCQGACVPMQVPFTIPDPRFSVGPYSSLGPV